MKIGLTFAAMLFLTTLIAHTGALELAAECVRADSGDYPEMRVYANTRTGTGLIVLSTGERAEEIFASPTQVRVGGSYQVHQGDISSEHVGTEGDSENYDQEVLISLSKNNSELNSWLKANTNLLEAGDIQSALFKCKN